MIRIIKQGRTTFDAYCARCQCLFAYDLDDLSKRYGSIGTGEYVACPNCGEPCMHRATPAVVSRRA